MTVYPSGGGPDAPIMVLELESGHFSTLRFDMTPAEYDEMVCEVPLVDGQLFSEYP